MNRSGTAQTGYPQKAQPNIMLNQAVNTADSNVTPTIHGIPEHQPVKQTQNPLHVTLNLQQELSGTLLTAILRHGTEANGFLTIVTQNIMKQQVVPHADSSVVTTTHGTA